MKWSVLFAVALLTACSSGDPSTDNLVSGNLDTFNYAGIDATTNTDTFPVTPGPEKAEPLYGERDGDVYFYVAAVSEEDRKKGRATGDVVGFRYLGKDGDRYRLQDANRPRGAINECTNPCRIIKTRYSDGSIERMAFSPTSIIGAAFTDAFNGYLEPVRREQANPSARVIDSQTPDTPEPQANMIEANDASVTSKEATDR